MNEAAEAGDQADEVGDQADHVAWLARLRRDSAGLIPAIVQEHATGDVLMLAWMDDEALRRTLTTGRATYFSRSRGRLWVKGETSGNAQYVRSVALDCDGDALLVRVDQIGPACHTGEHTCFHTDLPVSLPASGGHKPNAHEIHNSAEGAQQ